MKAAAHNGVSLPQVRTKRAARESHAAGCGAVRKSRRGLWRAMVLIAVWGLMIGHYAHWLIAGRTLTPIEPSESMQTLSEGLVNAGFVFFAAAIIATLVFGRFVCGWGCHIVALQDLCTWALRRLRIRPKPLRSRLLVFVPLLAALYMFVWPTAVRLWLGLGLPTWQSHFVTDDYWATFPGPYVAMFTFVSCGLLIVYVLGNKGFCTYACPYGGFFGPADLVAPGKIRVTDACEGCGHCTATCTSNVRVHDEVRLYGMVVDPGCMKCMDCVDVCPKNALYFGFGKPTVAAGAPRAARTIPRYDFSWPEELSMAGVFLIGLFAYRGLYDALPFLLSLGLSAITTYLFMTFARMLYVPSVRLHNLQLRLGGRTTRVGYGYAIFCIALLAFIGHALLVQYHTRRGLDLYEETARLYATPGGMHAPETDRAAAAALQHLEWVRNFGLVSFANLESRLGALYSFGGRADDAENHLRQAIKLSEKHSGARESLARLYAAQGRHDAAFEELREAYRLNPDRRGDTELLVNAAERLDRGTDAVTTLRTALERRPGNLDARMALGLLLAKGGDLAGGIAETQKAIAVHETGGARLQLGMLFAASGRGDESIAAVRRAIELDPALVSARILLAQLLLSTEQNADALRQADEARQREPLDPKVLATWAQCVAAAGGLPEAVATARAAPDDVAAAYRLVFLHLADGDPRAAAEQFDRARKLRPDLPTP